MKLIIRIALRNLLRQKSRTLLLGVGIGFGMMILVISHSFSNGLSDIILNRLIVDIMGHVSIASREKVGQHRAMVIRDKNEMEALIRETLPHVRAVREFVLTNMIKALGNRTSVFTVMIGLPDDMDSFARLQNLDVLSGSLEDFTNKKVQNPLILFSLMAEQLNVKVGDTVKLLMGTIYGQIQSAQLQLVAIVESQNPFMDQACMIPLENAKTLMGYEPYETQMLTIVLDNVTDPEVTLGLADKLQAALEPKPAVIFGTFKHNGKPAEGSLLGINTDGQNIDLFSRKFPLVQGTLDGYTQQENAIIIGKSLADDLQVNAGDTISFGFETRYKGMSPTFTFQVAAIIPKNMEEPGRVAFLKDVDFYKFYYVNLPQKTTNYPDAYIPGKNSDLYPLLAMNHFLFPRSKAFVDIEKKMREVQKIKFKGRMLDVIAMQEAADMVLKLEATLNIISLITVLILFFILLIGIVNTLRMTIKERTREIGTIRAVGMQKSQVYLSFMMETVFLALFASLGGITVGFSIIYFLSQMTFKPQNVFRIFMDQGHLHFVPNAETILLDLLLIIVITVFTAYFPSKRAANLIIADALGHHE